MLSNERQQLWRIAHRDKFSSSWRKRHDRIEAITKQLERLWHIHRIELAVQAKQQINATDRIADAVFDDYRDRVGDPDGIWRIEDETSHERHYKSVTEAFIDNQYASRPSSKKPNVGARQRKKASIAALSMI